MSNNLYESPCIKSGLVLVSHSLRTRIFAFQAFYKRTKGTSKVLCDKALFTIFLITSITSNTTLQPPKLILKHLLHFIRNNTTLKGSLHWKAAIKSQDLDN